MTGRLKVDMLIRTSVADDNKLHINDNSFCREVEHLLYIFEKHSPPWPLLLPNIINNNKQICVLFRLY